MWSVQRVSNQRHPPGWRAFCLLNYARKLRLAALSWQLCHFGVALRRFSVGCFILAAFVGAPARCRLCVSGPGLFRGASVSGPAWPVGTSRHRRGNGGRSWSAALTGWPPRLWFGCGRCPTAWPPWRWSAFYHPAAVLGLCFLPSGAVFVPLWFQNVTQRLIFFALYPKKRRAFLAPCRGRPQGVPFGLVCASFYQFCLNSPGPAATSFAVMRRLLGRLSAWGFGRGSRQSRERSLKAA